MEYKQYLSQWIKGITNEYRYWDNYFSTIDKKIAQDNTIAKIRMNARPDVIDSEILGDAQNVLDCGAGPISLFGVVNNQKTIKLDAVDPLAGLYKMILNKHRITPYVETKFRAASVQVQRGPS